MPTRREGFFFFFFVVFHIPAWSRAKPLWETGQQKESVSGRREVFLAMGLGRVSTWHAQHLHPPGPRVRSWDGGLSPIPSFFGGGSAAPTLRLSPST